MSRTFGSGIYVICFCTDHIQHKFDISFATAPRDIFERVSTVRLSSPVPGLSDPELCIQCPTCNQWYKSNYHRPLQSIRVHWNDKTHSSNLNCRTWYANRPWDFAASSLPQHYASSLFNRNDS
jgi:hypothetical protein